MKHIQGKDKIILENVVFVTKNMKAGGAERVIAQLANHMSNSGINCTIITLDNSEVFYPIDINVKLHAIGRKFGISYLDKIYRYKKLREYLGENKPQIVLALPEEIGIFVIPTLLGGNIPVIVSERNNPKVMPWKKVTRLMRILFYPLATGFIFQTQEAASFFPGFIRKKGIVLPNPIDLTRIPEPWKGDRRKEVVGAGRLEKQKNFPLLIRAFAKFYKKHPDYKLTIYGEGSMRRELETLANSLLPKGVCSFPGRTSDLLERINGAAMFVLSSDYEGMPNVVIEAMAMGMPVISTDCPSGGPSGLIENGKNGVLIPVGNVNILSDAMNEIAYSDDFSYQLGINAHEIIKSLNSDTVVEKWRTFLYEHVK